MAEGHRYKGRRETSSSLDSEESYEAEKERWSNNPPLDFYCTVCKAAMNSNDTWNLHMVGKRHIKAMKSPSYRKRRRIEALSRAAVQNMGSSGGRRRRTEALPRTAVQSTESLGTCLSSIPTKPSAERAEIQDRFDQMNDKPVVGLDFVNEIRRLDEYMGPMYYCSLCKVNCQVISMVDHVTGFRHRCKYLKRVNHPKYERVMNSNKRKSVLSERVARYVKKAQKQHGKGSVKVSCEVHIKSEENSSEEESIEEHKPTLPVPVPMEYYGPIEMKVRKVKPQEVGESFDAIRDPACRVEIMKTLGVKDTVKNTEIIKPIKGELALEMYIEVKIKRMTGEEQDKMVEECVNYNFASFCEYFQLDKLTPAEHELHSNLAKYIGEIDTPFNV